MAARREVEWRVEPVETPTRKSRGWGRRVLSIGIAAATLVAAVFLATRRSSGDAFVEPVRVFGKAGQHPGQFHMPRSIEFSPDGKRVYILDRTHRVQVFQPDGFFQEEWRTPPGILGNPRGHDVAPDGTLYVADTHNSQVVIYSPDGKERRRIGKRGLRPGEFVAVTDVALDPQGNLWTCEYGQYHDRVQKFDASGRFLLEYGTFGSGPGQFSRPQGITTDRDGNVYVADAANHRVHKLSPEGKPLLVWGVTGHKPGQLYYPYDVFVDSRQRIFVSEYGNNRVSVFDRQGQHLYSWGRPGHGPGEFDHPWGVCVAPSGEVWVADTMNYRIQIFPPIPENLASR